MKTPSIIAALAFLVCTFAAVNISAATLTVTKIEDTNDGVCDADCSLREAVGVAAADDTVVFSSLFNTPQTITLTLGQIAIVGNLTIDGPGQEMLTVSGNNASRIFRISGGPRVAVSGMRVANGLAAYSSEPQGGAIYLNASTLNLTNVTVTDNEARYTNQQMETFGYGGGIYSFDSTLGLVNSNVSNNRAPAYPATGGGGGIYCLGSGVSVIGSVLNSNVRKALEGTALVDDPSVVTITDSTLAYNTGAASSNSGGHTTVTRSIIRSNESGIGTGDNMTVLIIDDCVISENGSLGPAVENDGGTAYITNTTIRNNSWLNNFSAGGGGIRNFGTMYVLNSSITGNRVYQSGGGVFNAIGQLYLTNSTVSGNVADDGSGNCSCPGGGVYNTTGINNTGSVTLTNSTVANNRSAGLGGGIRNNAGTVTVRNSIIAVNISTTVPDFSGTATSNGFNLVGNSAGGTGWIQTDLLNLNPLLGPLGINGGPTSTHALLPNSPAINAASVDLARNPVDNSALIYDQRCAMYPRVVGKSVDMGAYEANYSPSVTVGGRISVTLQGRGISKAYITLTDQGGNIRYALTNPFGHYRLIGLLPGETYTIRVSHKSYQFDSPQAFTAERDRGDLNFIAQ